VLPHTHLGLIFFITNNVYTIIVCTNIQIKFRKASKKFLKSKEYTLSENERDGWFFKEYNKTQWNTISKKCRKVGLPPFKTARKTFETYALKLQVSDDIRYKLLGYATAGVKQNYQDWQWDELQDQIHEAHELVLSNFHIDTL